MKILFVEESFRKGGRQRRMLELLKELSVRDEIELHLIMFDDKIEFLEILNLNVNIHFVKKDTNIKLMKSYKEILTQVQPDIVQTWTLKSSLYFSFYRALYKYRLVASYIADCFGYRSVFRSIQGCIVSVLSNKIVGNSQAGLKIYKVPKRKSVVIYNGYDFSRVCNTSKENLKLKYNILTKYTVVMVATVSVYKDYHTFIEAARLTLYNRKDVTFLAIGGGKLLEQFRNFLNDEETQNIKFLGQKDQVEEFIAMADIGLLCSYSEGISNAIIEYMMHKKPVIATGCGGTSEIVINNETGYHLPVSNPKLVCEKINELLEDDLKKNTFGINGFNIAVNKFSNKNSVQSYLNIYNSI